MVWGSDASDAVTDGGNMETDTDARQIGRDKRQQNQATKPMATSAETNAVVWIEIDDETETHGRKMSTDHDPAINAKNATRKQHSRRRSPFWRASTTYKSTREQNLPGRQTPRETWEQKTM